MNGLAEIGHSSHLARFLQSMLGHRRNGGAPHTELQGATTMFKNRTIASTVSAAFASVLVSIAFVGAAVGPARAVERSAVTAAAATPGQIVTA